MILVVNTGSSSLKYKLFDSDLSVVSSANYSGIGSKIRNHTQAVSMMLSEIALQKDRIQKVGYRVVHGGDEADELMPVTLQTIQIIEKFAHLAPHHNPPAELVIRELIEKIPFAHHYAIFDTAFFKQLPDVAKIYPIDKSVSLQFGIKRFGFHGISHEYMMNEVDSGKTKKLITVHLGAGSSLSAIKNGLPIDTSMGFTPIEGIPMQTRSGDLDPEIILFLVDKIGSNKTRDIIENNSGLSGLTGTSGSMLSLLALAEEKVEDPNFHLGLDKTIKSATKEDAKLAIDLLCYKVKKYIGSYIAALGGIDFIVFSGEIGFGSSVIRNKILSGLKFTNFLTKAIKPDEELAIAKKLL